ncbi:hypothetical protein EDEG_02697 [Edhazardia aedis USNM 41457]|uniref:TAFII55 protein conserved region domain-containing protein n=1 Tax=Edhazardia aedis (strain USNM 41457) TaxID=1003232 RepID=J9DNG2_EDHAE|nr:hypothetical protein EDEG_02697 [Edhazardia aedis USNM 41457]|eukprot:EJW02932.1 hypothetical protein EDEG_02697 [Edhazardia aedis USNM 41457]
MENHFILSLPPSLSLVLHKNLKESLSKISIKKDMHFVKFVYEDKVYPAVFYNLPNILEAHKTNDSKQFYKACNVSNCLYVFEPSDLLKEKTLSLDDDGDIEKEEAKIIKNSKIGKKGPEDTIEEEKESDKSSKIGKNGKHCKSDSSKSHSKSKKSKSNSVSKRKSKKDMSSVDESAVNKESGGIDNSINNDLSVDNTIINDSINYTNNSSSVIDTITNNNSGKVPSPSSVMHSASRCTSNKSTKQSRAKNIKNSSLDHSDSESNSNIDDDDTVLSPNNANLKATKVKRNTSSTNKSNNRDRNSINSFKNSRLHSIHANKTAKIHANISIYDQVIEEEAMIINHVLPHKDEDVLKKNLELSGLTPPLKYSKLLYFYPKTQKLKEQEKVDIKVKELLLKEKNSDSTEVIFLKHDDVSSSAIKKNLSFEQIKLMENRTKVDSFRKDFKDDLRKKDKGVVKGEKHTDIKEDLSESAEMEKQYGYNKETETNKFTGEFESLHKNKIEDSFDKSMKSSKQSSTLINSPMNRINTDISVENQKIAQLNNILKDLEVKIKQKEEQLNSAPNKIVEKRFRDSLNIFKEEYHKIKEEKEKLTKK